MTVVKVQIPVASSHPGAHPLVYAEGRDRMQQQLVPGEVHDALVRDGSMKGFYEAEYVGGFWVIGKRVRDREW